MSPALLEKMRGHVRERAENRPGTYRFIGPTGEVLYVGKAVRLRTRLLSYFRAARGEKAAEIAGHAHRVEWDHTSSEFAALLAEFRLIKRWRPLYNVEHKRDAGFCFIKLTREPVPRILVARNAASDGAEYFGPLRGRTRMGAAVRALADLLELRDCPADTVMRLADQLELIAHSKDLRCMRGQTARCLSPCARGCTEAEYLARFAVARAFLNSETAHPLGLLKARIDHAVKRLQFEYAAELRDRMEQLAGVQGELAQLGRVVQQFSFLYTVPGHAGDDRVYVLRRGSVRAELPLPRTEDERRAFEATVQSVFARLEPERIGLKGHEAQETNLIARWFRRHPEELARTEQIVRQGTQPGQRQGG